MKSAGKVSSNSFVPCSGCPRWAKGIEPESNQASSTSGTRRMTPSHLSHGSVTVSMNGRCRSVRFEAQLGRRAYAFLLFAVVADPEWERRAPVARTRDRPVDVVLQPVAHAARLDVRRDPVGGLVVGDQLTLALCRADVPGVERVVDQRRAAAPRERVRVQGRLGLVEQSPRLEVIWDARF